VGKEGAMSDEYRRVRLWQVRQTDKAVLFKTPDRDVWVPRSQIKHISRNPPGADGLSECTVDVTEWFAEKESL
jgi:hypothetical protein